MIVICFDYNKVNFKSIPGIDADIRRVKRYFSKFFAIEIFKDEDSNKAKDAIIKNNFDAFYFSGHGACGNILFPDGGTISINELICQISRKTILIFDCCDTGDNSLPFKICRGKFRLTNPSSRLFRNTEILLIASANRRQKTVANKYGSKFTRLFIECLIGGVTNLGEIKQKISEQNVREQNVSIYCSKCDNKNLQHYLHDSQDFVRKRIL